jgi:hypothetical protein
VQDRHEYLWRKVSDTLRDEVVTTLVSLLVSGHETIQLETSLILYKYLKSLEDCKHR